MVLLAHCILNPNAKIAGAAQTRGAIPGVLEGLLQDGVGIVQLPCPEQTFGGCRRWGMTREQYDVPCYRKHCRSLLEDVVDQMEDYLRNGYEVLGIVGVDGSPSCGVDRTCAGYKGGEIASMPSLPEASTCGHLKDLEKAGTRVLVCGTCTNHFGVTEQVGVGTVSNMFEILEAVTGADKILSV